MRIPPLKALIAFESVARTKSVTSAAEELSLTPSAISHQIATLEELIGRPLFVREGRGLKITPVGERYLTNVSGLLADLGRVTDEATQDLGAPSLRVHCTPSFGLLWLLPRLKKFSDIHPDVEIKISCSYEEVSFTNGKYDLAIRYGYANWPGLDVLTLRGEFLMPLGSPDYLQAFPVKMPEDLLEHRLISSETHPLQWPQWLGRYGIASTRKSYDFCFDRSYMSLEAAALGMGLALESSVLAAEYLRKGRLVPVFGDECKVEIAGHHIVYPPNSNSLGRIRCFLNWISQESSGLFPATETQKSKA